jgi:hypothetical protein
MNQYQIPCECGTKTLVSRSQAGMRIPCAGCGKPIEVPTIRNLAAFAITSAAAKPVATKSSGTGPWILLGFIASIALIAGVGTLIYGSMLAWDSYVLKADLEKQEVDLTKTEEDFYVEMRGIRENAPPADTWDYWNALIEEGLSEPNPPEFFKIKRYIDSQTPWIRGNFSVAATSLTIFALSAFLMQRFRRRD